MVEAEAIAEEAPHPTSVTSIARLWAAAISEVRPERLLPRLFTIRLRPNSAPVTRRPHRRSQAASPSPCR